MTSTTSNYTEPGSAVCRGCLSTNGEMKNMFEWGLFGDFNIFADVPISRSEGVSELLCESCEESLQGCRTFRQMCQNSDAWFRENANCLPKNNEKEETAEENNSSLQEIQVINHLSDDKLLVTITTPEDQMEKKIFLTCPHKCQKFFLMQKDLGMHLFKKHGVSEQFTLELRYHCPFPTCPYNEHSLRNKHFTGRKNLNQHLKKAHRTKDFICTTCQLTFSMESEFVRHYKTCNVIYICALCDKEYKTNERLLVHLKRNHPTLHQQYKDQRKSDRDNLKRVSETVTSSETKKVKKDADSTKRDLPEYICDSPKRSFATQTLTPEDNIKNDVTLPSWAIKSEKSDDIDRNYSTIETQTVEDLLSLKSQNSEEESIFFSETVSLSDIQTQTFPVEFGLSRKKTITSETQTREESPDLSIKETQTCVCLYDSPKLNLRLFDSVSSSPSTVNLTSTETQTADLGRSSANSDVLLSFNSTETQTCFDDGTKKEI